MVAEPVSTIDIGPTLYDYSNSKTHKLTIDLISGAGELYDLVNDPNEMKNVFDHPDYAGV